MRINKILFLLIIAGLFVLNFSVFADDESAADFGLGLLLGVDTFDAEEDGGDPETFQSLALQPDLAIGKFGIGLDLVLHYRFEDGFEIREEDWVPQDDQTILDLYLPKITYVRWAYKGDPFYLKLGDIDDATIGTGFIVSSYSNTLFQPDEDIAGINFDLDAQLFNFPYIGFESFIGNLARFDVFGGRLYTRPMLWTGVPIIKNLEWGFTGATDRTPDLRSEYYDTDTNGGAAADTVFIYGTDLILPVITLQIASLSLFGDFAVQGENMGGMVGFGGRLIGILPYMFQLRILGDNFIPAYFDNTYDIYRGVKYDIFHYQGVVIEGGMSYLGSTGFSVLDDQLIFSATVDGPFTAIPTDSEDNHTYLDYPHLNAALTVEEGLIPDFSFSAEYDKKFINSWADLVSAEDSMINMAINYNAGAAVVTLSYDMLYLDDEVAGLSWDDFDVSSSLSCSIELF
ncbi:MAG: hypothetical protein PQJ61_01975 [Spirochaetales bacterium]|uniref:Uncharacterized protein n=1 Tax=Candidatus Thalassospirochaeta sargassi TaxID=3119039 RepID=A0AAJ1MMK3_9SPIO|nr:hypothetical protein [Spirochaetales bacterium]